MIKCIDCIYCKETWEGICFEGHPVEVCIHPLNLMVNKEDEYLEWRVTTSHYLHIGEDPGHGCEYGEEL